MRACTVEPSDCSEHLISRASALGVLAEGDDALDAGALRALRASRANCGLSRLITAAPPRSSPRKISALASAIASTEPKNSRCTGSTVVMIATCGRTSRVSGSISPAWFMPISNTA